jgi:hypothetical protein
MAGARGSVKHVTKLVGVMLPVEGARGSGSAVTLLPVIPAREYWYPLEYAASSPEAPTLMLGF